MYYIARTTSYVHMYATLSAALFLVIMELVNVNREGGGGRIQITTGTEEATRPTSSSSCMIFFIRACAQSWDRGTITQGTVLVIPS